YKLSILKGRKYKYLLDENKLYRCDKKFEKANLKLLEIFRQNYMTEVKLGKEELSQLFSVIIPKVKSAIKIENISEEEIEKYKPQILITKVYLDFDAKDNLIADVKFCYGEEEFNPLDEKQKIEIPRNMIKETKALNIFRKTGFMLDVKNLRFILPDDDKIYKFLTQDINYYMQNFEILATENFKKKQIKQPKMGSIGVKIENNLLSIDLNNLDIDVQELQKIMERYNLKKKYYRLKDGSFLELEDNKEVEFLDKLVTGMDLEYKDLEDGELQLPMYRSLYLEELLKKNKGNQVIKNNEYKNIVSELEKDNINEDVEVPKVLNNTLRYYQKIGFKWLKTLDKYRFGGILADDMGLGKTIQMLSIIMDYVQNTPKTERRASIVVSPSSLTLNWQNEAEKFTNNLQTLVINGTLAERKDKIKNIKDYDLVITSYDLLKRDIDLYKENKYQFRYIIADEAQYLKNSNTQNAKAIKKILADTRYALTGTPIENSLAELWSIFDYIMPGYLFSYKKFKSLYEIPIVKDRDMKAMEKLKMLIEPFVLRRTKTEVLTELPEKTVTILNSEMEEEQKNIYISYLAQAREEVAQEIKVNGIEKSHIKILALLTRLRQICCHPSLFIKDYNLGSSKLNQCLEIIEDAVKSEHKILLFSGYTSMFPIIEEQLQQLNIKYLKLTGATKVDERIEMVDEFNENPNIKVFLISLKAGGTGLNLTGADMVIHYDPWWNISTENQATDRAYRIGQKNNVQVYKLITKDSIEEKMYELQQKKAELIDNMLSTKTSFINKLSKEDIMNLFS
ncbi:MAG: DEAD/DEAH box helicase, partial [Clostridia bacterium]